MPLFEPHFVIVFFLDNVCKNIEKSFGSMVKINLLHECLIGNEFEKKTIFLRVWLK